MAKTYITIEGERLDSICTRHYGVCQQTVEAVLAANRGLAAQAAVPLTSGTRIFLPDLDITQTPTISLW